MNYVQAIQALQYGDKVQVLAESLKDLPEIQTLLVEAATLRQNYMNSDRTKGPGLLPAFISKLEDIQTKLPAGHIFAQENEGQIAEYKKMLEFANRHIFNTAFAQKTVESLVSDFTVIIGTEKFDEIHALRGEVPKFSEAYLRSGFFEGDDFLNAVTNVKKAVENPGSPEATDNQRVINNFTIILKMIRSYGARSFPAMQAALLAKQKSYEGSNNVIAALKAIDFDTANHHYIKEQLNNKEIESSLIGAAELLTQYNKAENGISQNACRLLEGSINQLKNLKQMLPEGKSFYLEVNQKIDQLQDVYEISIKYAQEKPAVAAATVDQMMKQLGVITKNFSKSQNLGSSALKFCQTYLRMSPNAEDEFLDALTTACDYVKNAKTFNKSMTEQECQRLLQSFTAIETVMKSSRYGSDLLGAIAAAKKPLESFARKASNASNANTLSARKVAAGVLLLGVVGFAIASAVTGNVAGFMQAGNMTKNCFAAVGVIAGATGAAFCAAYNREPVTAKRPAVAPGSSTITVVPPGMM